MDDVGDGGVGGSKGREGVRGFVKGGANVSWWEGRLKKEGEGEEEEEKGADEGFGVVHDEMVSGERGRIFDGELKAARF